MAPSQRKLTQVQRRNVALFASKRLPNGKRAIKLKYIAAQYNISIPLILKIEAEFNFKKPIDKLKEAHKLRLLAERERKANDKASNIGRTKLLAVPSGSLLAAEH